MTSRRQFLAGSAAAVGATAATRAIGATGGSRPNILLLFPDQWRHDWFEGTPGLEIRLPNLARLAARGVRFLNNICPAPICAPSRACLATGMEYDHQRTLSNALNFPTASQTFYGRLRDSGYDVLGVGKFDLAKSSNWWGTDGRWRVRSWGFSDGINNAGKWDQIAGMAINDGKPADPYTAFLQSRGLLDEHMADYKKRHAENDYGATFPTPLPDQVYSDNWIADNCLRLVDRVPSGQPWFMQVNFDGPHEPLDITATMESSVRGSAMPPVVGTDEYSLEKNRSIRQNYTAMCENIDRQAGLILGWLQARGELANTIVIFSSDHGEMLGDHGRWGKSVPYQPSASVPLVVAGPGVSQGRVSNALTETIDVTATILDYAGLSPTGMDGRSLRPVLQRGAASHRAVVYSGLGGWRMAWDGRYKVVIGFSQALDFDNDQKRTRWEPQLLSLPPLVFDLKNDPNETNDIASHMPEAASAMLRDLRAGVYRR